MILNPMHATDCYKTGHLRQYPKGTTKVYSNLTPRSGKLSNCGAEGMIFFGLQYFVKEFLISGFNDGFFRKPKEEVVRQYARRMGGILGKGAVGTEHIAALHDLGYLPIHIKALPEGTLSPFRVPVLTITNTDPRFYWLVNYLETVMSVYLWKPCTSATTAFCIRKELERYAKLTGAPKDFVKFQMHDFSFRGMSSLQDAIVSGAAHLLSAFGTDTIPAIDFLEQYYGADADKELIGCSVPATEHSVMCMGGKETEFDTFSRLLDEYPSGILSVVSDTWDFFGVLTKILPRLKDRINARDGKLVIRPDSGDPEKILCGDLDAPEGSPERKGAVRILREEFGGEINEKGFKTLSPKIGLIYGDGMSFKRIRCILSRLYMDGFSSDCVVFGIGSFTYQYVTRDTGAYAVKATYGEIGEERRHIQKNPKTDDGTKASACGLLHVTNDLRLVSEASEKEEKTGALRTVFKDGALKAEATLSEIRGRIDMELSA